MVVRLLEEFVGQHVGQHVEVFVGRHVGEHVGRHDHEHDSRLRLCACPKRRQGGTFHDLRFQRSLDPFWS